MNRKIMQISNIPDSIEILYKNDSSGNMVKNY